MDPTQFKKIEAMKRILSSESSSTCVVYYDIDEYIQTKQPQIPTLEKHVGENVDMTWEYGENSVELKGKGWVKKASEASKEEENLKDGDEQSLVPCSDELNKRADDFIARVNRQRKLELSILHYGT
ncbi:uncharacterized protein LOC109816430 [Cajanus cajan]|uniref:uncharacterized protein LOC109816430 n=1 Tax=Cajanus cajan TaxID=3821 RepID=UPI0010FB6D64|nr:uncharacterized protein LOC109816430 [Cajanus cajan]